MYMNLRPYTLSHRSPPSCYQPSPPSRRRLSPPRRTLSPPPAGLCRHRPAGLCRHSPADSVATAAASLVPTISSKLSTCAMSVARLCKTSWRTYGGSRFEYTAKTGHFEKSLHLTRTLDARCPNVKFVHKNSLCFMEIIIFQLLSCLYFYDSGIEVPVNVRK